MAGCRRTTALTHFKVRTGQSARVHYYPRTGPVQSDFRPLWTTGPERSEVTGATGPVAPVATNLSGPDQCKASSPSLQVPSYKIVGSFSSVKLNKIQSHNLSIDYSH